MTSLTLDFTINSIISVTGQYLIFNTQVNTSPIENTEQLNFYYSLQSSAGSGRGVNSLSVFCCLLYGTGGSMGTSAITQQAAESTAPLNSSLSLHTCGTQLGLGK